jgi:small nuclear ribonucleoprotein (snRNP)-like protein
MIFVKYKNGRTLQGILVALGDQLVRVALKNAEDAAIFRLVSGVWVSEDCEVVTFEFAENGFAPQDITDFREAVFPNRVEPTVTQRVM